jgi:hypothetical protein
VGAIGAQREHGRGDGDDEQPAHALSCRFVTLRGGRYEVQGVLGTGGMGVVREAVDREQGGRVAVKSLRAASPERLLRFKNEFRVARDLHHPNLVRLGELFEERGEWFFTMELIRGVELLAYVRDEPAAAPSLSPFDSQTSEHTMDERARRPPGAAPAPARTCDVGKLRAVVAQVARGLVALHRAGLVHRDVKPSNVLVEASGRAVLVDFGIAIEHADAPLEPGHVIGTVSFMAPEQISGGAVGPAADWYAVGALLFVALAGRPPFTGGADEVMAAKTRHDGPAPSTVRGGIPHDLDRLCERLLSLDPALRPGGDEVLRALGVEPEPSAPGVAPFVGREALLADLDARFAASQRTTVVVTLEGDSGIGKTALATQAIARWRGGAVVLRGRCHEREAIPYNAIDGVIDDLGRELARLDEAERARVGGAELAELARLFPTLATGSELAPMVRDPIAARRHGFAALRAVLRRLALRRPLVIAIDDVQWADVDSLAALEVLVAPPAPPALLLIATARSTEARPWRAPAAFAGAVRHPLDGLGAAAVEAMAAAFGRRDIDLERLCHETAGNPMLLEQWLSLPGGDGAPPPAAFDAVVAARSARLSPAAAAVLDTVVVAGRAVAQAAVAAASEVGPDGFDAAVAELAAARFARRDGTRPTDSIEVFHDRIREHVYKALAPARGRALHGRLADALIAAGGAPDAIATQLSLAGQHARAAVHARAAAEAAERALAFERAAALYRMALDGAPAEELGALRVRLAGALASAGRPEEAGTAFLAAAASAATPAEQLELRRRGAEQLLAGGYLDRGLEEARAILAETGGGRLPRGTAGALFALIWHRARLAVSRLRWRRRAEAEVPQEVLTRLDIHWSMSIGLALTDSLRGAVFALRLPILCLPHGEELRIARAMCSAAAAHAGMGLRRPAQRLLAAASRAAEAHGSPLARFYAGLGEMIYTFLADNDWRATQARCERLGALWREAGRGRGWEVDTVEQFASFSDLWLGRFRAVEERVGGMVRLAADAGNRYQEVGLRAYFASLQTLLGEPDACEREVGVALARWSGDRPDGNQAYWGLRSRTYAAMYRGDTTVAPRTLDPAWARLRGSLLLRVPSVAAEAHAALGAYEVTLAVLARDPGARRARLAAARRVAKKLGRSQLSGAKMAFEVLTAGIEHVAGNDDAALRHLRAAAVAFEASGMEALLAAARLRIGAILGGSKGDQLRADALAWFARERIPAPERTAALLTPGWHPDA